MRSSAAKLTLGAVAWLAFAAAPFFVISSEQQLTVRRGALSAFDVVARETSASLASLKAAQQGYVAPGQGIGQWMSRVDASLKTLTERLEELRRAAAATESRKTLEEATGTLGDLRAIDKRARQYLNSDQTLMASDVIFSEGGETAVIASRQVEAARQSEYTAFGTDESDVRRRQVLAASAAGGVAALIIAALILLPSTTSAPIAIPEPTLATRGQLDAYARASGLREGGEVAAAAPPQKAASAVAEAPSEPPTKRAAEPMAPDLPREIVPILAATAELCAELNRVHEFDEFTHLLGRAAEVLDASGIVIWVAAPGASLLRPVLAHGYSPHALARMPRVPRTGDNAAAAAFRTGKLQIVLSRPGMSAGALAAPMLTPNGCIGALTAEIKNGGETSDGVQALASIFASQLAGVLADSVLQEQEDEVGDDTQVPRTASA
jgi:hypothetical protein